MAGPELIGVLTYGRLLMALLAWGVFAFGAVYPWAYWPLALGAAALGFWGIVRGQAWTDPRLRTLGVALAVLSVAVGAQLVRMPYGLATTLSPGLENYLSLSRVGYAPPAVLPLSIAPGHTFAALALLVAFSLLLIGLARTLRQLPLEFLVNQLMGLAVALVVLGVVQKAFTNPADTTLVYGFWKPLYGGNPFGPFINRNHFAGWMVMILPVVLGYSYAVVRQTGAPVGERADAWRRWLLSVDAHRFLVIAVVALAMGMALALTNSRSGIAACAVSLLVLGHFLRRQTAGDRARRAASFYLTLVLAAALIWAGLGQTVAAFLKAPGDLGGRFDAWADALRIARDFPWFGVGLGAFGRAMLVYQTMRRETLYLQAHNDYLQVLVEGGLVVAVPAAVVLVLIGRAIARRFAAGSDDPLRYWLRAGAVAGLAGIAAQSLVEFSLQMPANTATCVVLIALALHRPSRRNAHAHRV